MCISGIPKYGSSNADATRIKSMASKSQKQLWYDNEYTLFSCYCNLYWNLIQKVISVQAKLIGFG